MNRSGLQRLVPIVLVLIVVVLAGAALVSLGRTLFSGGSSPSSHPKTTVNTGKQALIDTGADRSVRMTVRGPIVARENAHSYTITVSPDARNMTTHSGYTGKEIDNDQMQNDSESYTQFVHALDRANLMAGTPLHGSANDTDGLCATGYLYSFEVLQGDNSVRKLWTTTCPGSPGSLKANLTQVTNLFRSQIPDFSRLLAKINMSS